MPVNKNGYLVNYHPDDPDADGEHRTYACTDREGLDALILHLTGRTADSYPQDSRGLPRIPALFFGPAEGFKARLVIAHPFHIWTGEDTSEDETALSIVREMYTAGVSNSPGPLFSAGFAEACKAIERRLLAAKE